MFKSGQPLFGKDGAFHQVLEDFLNAALEGEMQGHLEATKPESGNRRNGKMLKQIKTEYGPAEIETPRDRDGSFEPETVKIFKDAYSAKEASTAVVNDYIGIGKKVSIDIIKAKDL